MDENQLAAIEELAKWLHFIMGDLNPYWPNDDWHTLTDFDKDFYCSCVEMLLDKRDVVLRALSYDIVFETEFGILAEEPQEPPADAAMAAVRDIAKGT